MWQIFFVLIKIYIKNHTLILFFISPNVMESMASAFNGPLFHNWEVNKNVF